MQASFLVGYFGHRLFVIFVGPLQSYRKVVDFLAKYTDLLLPVNLLVATTARVPGPRLRRQLFFVFREELLEVGDVQLQRINFALHKLHLILADLRRLIFFLSVTEIRVHLAVRAARIFQRPPIVDVIYPRVNLIHLLVGRAVHLTQLLLH